MSFYTGTSAEIDLAQDEALWAEARSQPVPSFLIRTEDDAYSWLADRYHPTLPEDSYNAMLTDLHSRWDAGDEAFWGLVDRVEDAAGEWGGTMNRMSLNDEQVVEIRRLCAQGVRQADVAARFGITPQAVSKIKRGRSRPNLPGAVLEDGRGKLTALQRREVLALLDAGVPQRDIAERFGVTQPAIALIKLRERKRATSRGR